LRDSHIFELQLDSPPKFKLQTVNVNFETIHKILFLIFCCKKSWIVFVLFDKNIDYFYISLDCEQSYVPLCVSTIEIGGKTQSFIDTLSPLLHNIGQDWHEFRRQNYNEREIEYIKSPESKSPGSLTSKVISDFNISEWLLNFTFNLIQ
jgi:hypothetical protein